MSSPLKAFVLNTLPQQIRKHYSKARECMLIDSFAVSEFEGHGVIHLNRTDETFDTWEWLPSTDGSGMHCWQMTEEAQPMKVAA